MTRGKGGARGQRVLVLAALTLGAGIEEVLRARGRVAARTSSVYIAFIRGDAEGLRPIPHEAGHAALARVVGGNFVAGDDFLVGGSVFENLNAEVSWWKQPTHGCGRHLGGVAGDAEAVSKRAASAESPARAALA